MPVVNELLKVFPSVISLLTWENLLRITSIFLPNFNIKTHQIQNVQTHLLFYSNSCNL